MAKQFSTTFRNNAAGQFETTVGTAPKLQLLTGAPPANCAAAATGTLLAELTLPTDWLTAPSSGQVALNGTWSGTGLPAAGAGTAAAHYRVVDSAGTTCHEQGTVTVTGGGGDLTVDNVSIANAQPVSITSWTLTVGGA